MAEGTAASRSSASTGAAAPTRRRLARRARRAEEVGFESLWVGDHIALPADAPGDNPARGAAARSRSSRSPTSPR